MIWGRGPDRLSATLQAALGGNRSPSADDINKILSSGEGRCPVVGCMSCNRQHAFPLLSQTSLLELTAPTQPAFCIMAIHRAAPRVSLSVGGCSCYRAQAYTGDQHYDAASCFPPTDYRSLPALQWELRLTATAWTS